MTPVVLLVLWFVSGTWAYEATWESLDSRPLPEWYDQAKFGIFVHWGVFSVPAFKSEWFWYNWKIDRKDKKDHHEYVEFVEKTELPGFAYADYAHRFDAALFEPQTWAEAFAQSGAQYVVLTSKHHEGFCNWDSRDVGATWNWNSVDIGPRRDLVGDLAAALRKDGLLSPQTNRTLKFGVYHSLLEWFNPLFLQDLKNNFTTSVFADLKTMPELYQLVEMYKPEVIWSDGDWSGSSDYWKAKEFLAWLATNSSVKDTVVWNDRWGKDASCKHGSFWNCADKYLPNSTMDHKWENCLTIDAHSWGWNRKAKLSDFKTTKELIDLLVTTVSRNGNMLLNVGPAADGTISPIFLDRLKGIGDWLMVNGQAIYKTSPWKVCDQDPQDPSVHYTRDNSILYVHLTKWPEDNRVVLECPQLSESTETYLLGMEGSSMRPTATNIRLTGGLRKVEGTVLQLPSLNPSQIPCDHVWVVAMTAIQNLDEGMATTLHTVW